MKEITNIGNLPKPLQVLAKEVQGQRSTKFYEYNTADELLDDVANGKGEETSVIIDRENNKGFMTAFSFKDIDIVDFSGDKMITMSILFTELKSHEIQYYSKKLHKARQEQEISHKNWKNKQQPKGSSND